MNTSSMTAQEYLANLPADRREVIAAARELILANLPQGYREIAGPSGLQYVIPLERYPDTYNRQPLPYLMLAAYKSYNTLYLMGVYGQPGREEQLRDAFTKAGKKFDMGKSCLHFKKLEDLALDAVAAEIASVPAEAFIAFYERARKKQI
jgi:hypothetical protein